MTKLKLSNILYLKVHLYHSIRRIRSYGVKVSKMGSQRALMALTNPNPSVRQMVIENAAHLLLDAMEYPVKRSRAIEMIWRVTMALMDDEIEAAWDGTSHWYKSPLLNDVMDAASMLYEELGFTD